MSVTVQLDHSAVALSRLAAQYQEATNFRAFISAITSQSTELEQAFFKIAEISDIDLAEGVNLDVIGDLVGVSRIIDNAIVLQFFGFSDNPDALTFGEEGNISIGGRLYNEGESTLGITSLQDPEFRLLIRAKIVKNHSKGTIPDIIDAMSYLFDGAPCIVEDDEGGMQIGLGIGKPITQLEKALIFGLDILPRPAGVRFYELVSYQSGNYFGWDTQVGALGFSEEVDISPLADGSHIGDGSTLAGPIYSITGGGIFAEEIVV